MWIFNLNIKGDIKMPDETEKWNLYRVVVERRLLESDENKLRNFLERNGDKVLEVEKIKELKKCDPESCEFFKDQFEYYSKYPFPYEEYVTKDPEEIKKNLRSCIYRRGLDQCCR